jgi:hypothetical protein
VGKEVDKLDRWVKLLIIKDNFVHLESVYKWPELARAGRNSTRLAQVIDL